jgi:hypothetical protein
MDRRQPGRSSSFDTIMDVRVAAVSATQSSWRSPRPVRQERFNSARACELRRFDREGVPLPLTQTQLATAVADRAEITSARPSESSGRWRRSCWRSSTTRKRCVSVVLCS